MFRLLKSTVIQSCLRIYRRHEMLSLIFFLSLFVLPSRGLGFTITYIWQTRAMLFSQPTTWLEAMLLTVTENQDTPELLACTR